MNRRTAQAPRLAVASGLVLFGANACRAVLGIDSNSTEVECVRDSDCDAPARCIEFECRVEAGGAAGNGGGTSRGGSGNGGAIGLGGSAGLGSGGETKQRGGTGGNAEIAGGTAGATATANSGGGGLTGPSGGVSGTAGSALALGGSAGSLAGGSANGGASPAAGSAGLGGVAGAIVGGGGSAGTTLGGGAAGTAGMVFGGTAGASGAPSGGIAGQAGSGGCTNSHRCWAYPSFDVYWQTCSSTDVWSDAPLACADYCKHETGCATAPSCSGFTNNCTTNVSCCNAKQVPGGTFDRSPVYGSGPCSEGSRCPATVSTFSLDTFEVTVARFRNFVDSYPSSIPAAGAGRNPHNPADQGWDTEWRARLPSDVTELRQYLSAESCPNSTFTAEASAKDFVAMNCVSWYLAYAFCAWDGGRLPTEAEWNYAAAGGDQDRYFPWSDPFSSTSIQPGNAIYSSGTTGDPTEPAVVGAALGRARWGHFDLAGNVAEWVLDAWSDPYAETRPCIDCANTTWSTLDWRVVRGGGYSSTPVGIRVASRLSATASNHANWIGLRCARDL